MQYPQSDHRDQVQSHYNVRKDYVSKERPNHELIYLRNFNNLVKSLLIGDAVSLWKLQSEREITVLDLACGKGGDISKWQHFLPRLYVGMDISECSVKDAQDRSLEKNLDWTFMPQDVSQPFDLKQAFSICSMQFALHYMVKSLETTIQNVSHHLVPGGIFIATTTDAEKIQRFKNNDVCQIELFQDHYLFTLKDCVEKCPEYFVDEILLLETTKKHGLKLVKKEGFQGYYYNKGQFKKFGPRSFPMDQWNVVHLYKIYIFQKE